MPLSNGLQPPLTPAEKAVVKTYGDWTNFMASYCLKPWNDDDVAEAMAILRGLAKHS